MPGSTLDLNQIALYANGVRVLKGEGPRYGGGTIVPEPATLGLLIAGCLALLRRAARPR